MRNVLLAASALTLIAAPAFAQDQSPEVYANIGYSVAQISSSGFDWDVGSITARAGVNLHPNFAVEGELSYGVDDDTVDVGGGDVTIENEYDLAIYGVAVLPISEQVQLFARLGFGHTEGAVSGGGISESIDGKSWNFGAGGQFMIDGQNGFRADWTRRDFTEDGGELDVYSVSFVRRF